MKTTAAIRPTQRPSTAIPSRAINPQARQMKRLASCRLEKPLRLFPWEKAAAVTVKK